MFELSIWSRWRVVNHPIPPSLPLALKLIHELIYGCDTSPSLLSFYLSRSIYTEPAASFLIRLHREEAGRCLLLSKDSSTTSSLPGLAPPPPSPFGQTCPTSPAKWPKGTVPGSCRPSFRLNRATNFFVAKPFVSPPPSVKEARIPPPPRCLAAVPPGWAPAAVAIVVVVFGPKNFRAMENNRIYRERFVRFLPIFWRFSRTLRGNWRPALLDGRGGGGWRLDCSRKPAGERASQILRGGSGLFLWHRDEDGFERSKRILDSFVKGIVCRRLVRCGVVDRPEFLFPTTRLRTEF